MSAVIAPFILLLPRIALGRNISPPSQMQPLTDAELSTFHGGFVAPGGLQIDIGVSSFASASLLNEPLNAVSGLIQYGSNTGEIIIQNGLSNAALQVSTQLNVDVANYTQLRAQLAAPVQNMIGGVAGFPLPH